MQRLQTEFIPFAGRRLDLERPPLGEWWSALVRSVNPRWQPGVTSQGSYVVGADGTGYAFDNYNRDPRRFLVLLDRGLAGFRQRPPRPVTITAAEARACAVPPLPAGVSVVRVFTRVRPLPAGEPPEYNFVGREQMWIFPEEVRELLAASERGDGPFPLPRTLAARIVLFHVVDNTRGQPYPWRPQEVRRATFTARVTRRPEGRRAFSFTGDYAKQGSTPFFTDRGHEGRMEGEFELDPKTAKIVRFRAYGEGQAWAKAPYARPGNPPPGRYPLVIAIIDANDALSTACPPEPSETGEYYRRPPLP